MSVPVPGGLLAGRRALVTGAANGLGARIVSHLAAAGAIGVALDLPVAPVAELPPGWSAVGADLREEDHVARAFAQVDELLDGLDIVVAAAGIVPRWAGIEALDLDEWEDVFAVNVRGVLATIRHGARRMGAGGAIVAMGSLNSWRGDPNIAGYVASKHAVLGIVRSAALDLGRRGIRVNAVGPGPIATEALLRRMERREHELGVPVGEALASAASATALGRMASEDDVAAAVVFLASPMAAGVTGHLLPVDAGST